MDKRAFDDTMNIIVDALKERGYDPYMQLCGYIKENEPMYITSHKNARVLIQTPDKRQIEAYVMKMK